MCKKIPLKTFFRSHFPLGLEPSYILFENMKTGWFDIVGRSGIVLFSVPPMPGETYKERKALADEICDCLAEGSFGLDSPGPSQKLCRVDECRGLDSRRFDYEDCYPQAEYPYHPDDFKPYSMEDIKKELSR